MYQHGGNIYKHKNILDFSTNINPVGTPESVIAAAYEGIKQSFSYPDTQCEELRNSLSKTEQIPMESIICGNGAADLIFSLVLSHRPKKALIPIPTFHEYEQALQVLDCDITYYPMKEEDDFKLQEDFLHAITSDLDIIFLCNPNNPTGHLIPRDLLEQILMKCDTYNILLVMDECFMDFVENPKIYTMKENCKNRANLFIVKAFTKLYAIPGLRLGYGMSNNKELLHKMKEVSQPWSVSTPAQMAGIAALKETEYVKQSYDLLQVERAYLSKELLKMNFKTYDSNANYIFFQGKPDLYNDCLKKGILIRNCSNYKSLDETYYRIAIKDHNSNEQLIKTFWEVI